MDDLKLVRKLAFDAGYQYALTAAAQRVDELDAVWRPVARPTYEQRVAQRVTAMEAWAVRQPWNRWRGFYPGGPVDFETGQLLTATAGATT